MALRVKCKCGKSLKIPSELAGKRIACPGCKKTFAIPVETFRAAEAKLAQQSVAAAPRPAPPKPEPAMDVGATPSELDLLGDISHSSSDLLGDVPPVAPSKPCPNCRFPMAEDARLCTQCGFDTLTGKVHKGAAIAGKAGRAARAVGGFAIGVLFSGIGAALGGVVWFLITWYASLEVGYVAWGIGLAAGFGMYLAKQEGAKAGLVAAAMAVSSIVIAKIVIFAVIFYAVFSGDTDNAEVRKGYVIICLANEMLDEKSVTDHKEREAQWEATCNMAKQKVSAMNEATINAEWQRYREQEASEEVASAVTASAPSGAKSEPDTSAGATDETPDEESGVLPLLGMFFQVSFGIFDALWILLAVGSAYRIGSSGIRVTNE